MNSQHLGGVGIPASVSPGQPVFSGLAVEQETLISSITKCKGLNGRMIEIQMK
jgi:hypothetical protein